MFERHFCFGIFYIENSIFVKQTGPCASKEEPLTLSTVPLWFWIVGSFKWIKYANKYANKPINKYFACTENETTNHCRGKKINDDEFEPFSVTLYGKNNLSWINICVSCMWHPKTIAKKYCSRLCQLISLCIIRLSIIYNNNVVMHVVTLPFLPSENDGCLFQFCLAAFVLILLFCLRYLDFQFGV